jgi:hypothetical protein
VVKFYVLNILRDDFYIKKVLAQNRWGPLTCQRCAYEFGENLRLKYLKDQTSKRPDWSIFLHLGDCLYIWVLKNSKVVQLFGTGNF